MKLPINWLKEYVGIDNIPAEKLADILTMIGLEVESVDSSVNFSGVVVGEVLERTKHPNADKLNVAKVKVGKETLEIVCGAPNLNAGQKVAVALPGAKLGDFEITQRELRGIVSNGMICSEKELALGEDHSGIMVLDKKAQVGMDFSEYITAEKVLDIKVFANRPDMMGVVGLARETAAGLGKKLKVENVAYKESSKCKTADSVEVEIKNFELCPRYVARVVEGVKIEASPNWMQERLTASGVRPINNLVDISNYVMLEYGQPLHFFDLDKVKSKAKKAKIIVRNAKNGEEMITLDGVKRKLTSEMLVIADENKAIALAGVMGGENTEVDDKTKSVLIEAAVFEKSNIRKTSRALGLRSEAVARFEKGLPLEMPETAIDRAVQLLAKLAGGEVCEGKVDVKADEVFERKIQLRVPKLNSFLGINLDTKEVVDVLTRLEFGVEQGEDLAVSIPWWRPDVVNETDLFEEVARIWGYEKIPSTLPETGTMVPEKNESFELSNEVRKLLSDIGLTEILTYSFISGKELEAIGQDLHEAPKLENPLVAEQEYMRTSLAPHMLDALSKNQFNKEHISFYEIGKTFKLKNAEHLPEEEKILCVGVVGGETWPINYKEGKNFYEIKGVISRLFAGLKLYNQRIEIKPISNYAGWANVYVNEESIGYIGEITSDVLNKFGLKRNTAIAEINLDKISVWANKDSVFEEFSKYPKVTRDLSAILDRSVEVGEIKKALCGVSNLVYRVEIVDIYEGKPLEKNEKSVTFRVEFSSKEKTLEDKDIEKLFLDSQRIITKFGGKIRGAKE